MAKSISMNAMQQCIDAWPSWTCRRSLLGTSYVIVLTYKETENRVKFGRGTRYRPLSYNNAQTCQAVPAFTSDLFYKESTFSGLLFLAGRSEQIGALKIQ